VIGIAVPTGQVLAVEEGFERGVSAEGFKSSAARAERGKQTAQGQAMSRMQRLVFMDFSSSW